MGMDEGRKTGGKRVMLHPHRRRKAIDGGITFHGAASWCSSLDYRRRFQSKQLARNGSYFLGLTLY